MKLTSQQKRALKRVITLDRYMLKKSLAKIEQAAAGFAARYVVGKRRLVAEQSFIARYVARKKRYPLGPALFFDLQYYMEAAEESFDSIEAAMVHYEANAAEGKYYKTHPLFDPDYYLTKAGQLGGLSPVSHYLQYYDTPGLCPTPYFDADFYLWAYKDVAEAKVNPYIHYLRFGRMELRQPHPLVDPQFYLLGNREAAAAREDPVAHYLVNAAKSPHATIHPLINKPYIMKQARNLGLPLGNREPLLIYLEHGDSHRIDPHPLFDADFYRFALQDSGKSLPKKGESLLAHFLRTCKPEHPIDPSTAFSTVSYWRRNPDIGRMNPLYHYVRYGSKERRPVFTSMLDLSDPKNQPVLDLEPTILAPHQDLTKIFSTVYPNPHHPGYSLVRGVVKDIGSFRADTIFLFSAFRRGGAEKFNLKLIQTILDLEPERRILIILTDQANDEASHWCPEHPNLRTTTFSHEPDLPAAEAATLLARLVELLRPLQVVNCNSQIGWDAYRDYGMPLSTLTKLRASLFCYDYDKFGRKVGYARDYVRETISHLDLIFVDNKRFIDDLANDFSLSSEEKSKLKVLYQPLDSDQSAAPELDWPDLRENVKHPRLLWPMRFHRQKCPDVLRELALRMPDVEFCAWVPGGSWSNQIAGGRKPANVTMIADTKQSFDDLDLASYCGILSTSKWEGLPTIILEGVEAGLPVVASNVGGVGEAVSRQTGYLISDFDDIDQYERAILALLSDPAGAEQKRQQAYAHVKRQHSRAAFHKRLRELGLLQGTGRHVR